MANNQASILIERFTNADSRCSRTDHSAVLMANDELTNCRSALKILYHHRTRSADGQSVHIDSLIGALRAAGHGVVVVGPGRIPATRQPVSGRLLPRFVYELLECGYNLVEFTKLVRAITRYRPHSLYQRANIFTLSAVWAARLFRLPLLLEVNAPLALERSKFGGMAFPRLGAWTERWAWRAADWVLPVTGVLARDIQAAGVPNSHVRIIPNGTDLEKMKATDSAVAKQRLGFGSELVIGFVGFFREWHRLENVVDLMGQDPALATARLLIVGDGPTRASIHARARANGCESRISITGVVPHDQLASFVSAMDIALQPEVTPYASPLKLFDYMGLGRAIVAPDTENIREILEDRVDALLFSPGDSNSMADKIRIMALDPALRERLGKAAAAKIQTRGLTWQHNAATVAALIERIARPHNVASNQAT